MNAYGMRPAAYCLFALALIAVAPAAYAQSALADEAAYFEALDEPRWISLVTASDRTYALVLSYLDNGIQVIDVTDPTAPAPVTTIRDGEGGFEALGGGSMLATVEISGTTYALAAGWLDNAVQIIDVTDPTAPQPVSAIHDGEGGFDGLGNPGYIETVVASDRTYALVANFGEGTVVVIDITDPTAPEPVSILRDGEGGFDGLQGALSIDLMSASGHTYAMVASLQDGAVQVIDVTDPTAPAPAAIMRDEDGAALQDPSHVELVTISDHTYALISSLSRHYVHVMDVTDPTKPEHVVIMRDGEGGFEALYTASRIVTLEVSGNTYAFVSSLYESAIQVIDITDPAAPAAVAVMWDGMDGFDGLGGAGGMRLVATPDATYLLVTGYLDDSVQIIDVTDPTAPEPVTAVFDRQDVAPEAADAPEEWRVVEARFDGNSIESRVLATVLDTVVRYASDGEDALAEINAGTPGYHYPFVLDAGATTVLAHGAFPRMAGEEHETFSMADRPLEDILADISRDGGTWVNHMFPNPDTGIVQQMRSWLYIHDGLIFGSGYYIHDYMAQTLVDEALDAYRLHGEAAFDMITPDEPLAEDRYVHVIDIDTAATVAHGATPSEVGTVSDVLLYKAAKPYEQIVEELEAYGHAWVSYVYMNPAAQAQQLERVWMQLQDGHIFMSGYYLPDSRVKSLAEGAQLLYQSNGEAAFDIITPQTQARTDSLYPYVIDVATNVEVASGAFPDNVGKVFSSFVQQDRPNEEVMADLARNGHTWVSYVITNPDTNTEQVKRAWMQLHDGYAFASGYYLPDARVQAVVDLAVSTYRSVGEEAFDRINAGEGVVDDSFYPVVMTTANVVVASATPPPLSDLGGLSVLGDWGGALYEAVFRDGSAWMQVVSINPATGTPQVWRGWTYLYDDYLFMSGYYVPDSEIQSVVDKAVFLYNAHGEDAWDIITPEEPINLDKLYVFVSINDPMYCAVAHGALPDRVGRCGLDPIRLTGDRPFDEVTAELHEDGGAWVTYIFKNPNTGTDQNKRTWLHLHDGYVFGSGYYIRDSQVQAIVRSAIHAYDVDPQNTLDRVNALAEGEPAQTYPFIIDAATYDVVAHGYDTDRVGTASLALTAADRPAEDILAELEGTTGIWSYYTTVNPLTGEEQLKRTWLALHDGYVFGSGYHDIDVTR